MFVLLTNVMRAKVHKILQTETFFWGEICRKNLRQNRRRRLMMKLQHHPCWIVCYTNV